MNSPTQALELTVRGSSEPLRLEGFTAVVAGYTGRDEAAVQHHIDELAAIGIAPPPAVPMFYPVDAGSVTAADRVVVAGERTSGEIEPVYIRAGGRYYLGIGSDHTDREVETVDIGESKKACPKPIASTVVPVEDLAALSLDAAAARTWVDGRLYQEGTLDGLRTPANVVELLLARTDVGDGDFICLGGTLPVIGGDFVYGAEWRLELTLPDGTVLAHTYTTSKGN
jgi:hypothetical protein